MMTELQLNPSAFEFDRRDVRFSPTLTAPRQMYVLKKVTNENGLLVYYEGMHQPHHGLPFREASTAVDTVKRYAMSLLPMAKSVATWQVKLALVSLSWTNKLAIFEGALQSFTEFADRTFDTVRFHDGLVGTIRMKTEYYSPCSRGVRKLVTEFLSHLGVHTVLAGRVGAICGIVIEHDDAYRYRLQDILSCTTVAQLWENPAAELTRLLTIYEQREQDRETRQKIGGLWRLLIQAFRIGTIRRAWLQALDTLFPFPRSEESLAILKLDTADRYHVHLRTGYHYLGLTDDQRQAAWVQMHAVLPVTIPQPQPCTVDSVQQSNDK